MPENISKTPPKGNIKFSITLSEEQKRKMSESLKLAWQKRKTKKL